MRSLDFGKEREALHMDPVLAIVWICVAVFAITSAITLLYLMGWRSVPVEHGRLLFKLLISEIVISAVAAFTYAMQSPTRDDNRLRIPVVKQIISEQLDFPVIYDGNEPLYFRATDVSRANRFVDLQFDTNSDFSEKKLVKLLPHTPQLIHLGQKTFRVIFTETGVIDADPQQRQSKTKDFAFISIEKIK